MKRTLAVFWLTAILLSLGFGQATHPAPRHIPFDLFRNALPFVKARINGSTPMWFLLDTGSTYSFLDTAQAAALGIKTADAQTITGSGGGQLDLTFAEGL